MRGFGRSKKSVVVGLLVIAMILPALLNASPAAASPGAFPPDYDDDHIESTWAGTVHYVEHDEWSQSGSFAGSWSSSSIKTDADLTFTLLPDMFFYPNSVGEQPAGQQFVMDGYYRETFQDTSDSCTNVGHTVLPNGFVSTTGQPWHLNVGYEDEDLVSGGTKHTYSLYAPLQAFPEEMVSDHSCSPESGGAPLEREGGFGLDLPIFRTSDPYHLQGSYSSDGLDVSWDLTRTGQWTDPEFASRVLTPTQTTATAVSSGSSIVVSGVVTPTPPEGYVVNVKLYKKKGGQFVRAGRRFVSTQMDGTYTAGFHQQKASRCRATAEFEGNPVEYNGYVVDGVPTWFGPSEASYSFPC